MRFTIIFLLSCQVALSQSYTISGFIKDEKTGEVLSSASVLAVGQNLAAETNQYGYYSLKVAGDSIEMQFSFVGYEKKTVKISVRRNLRLDVELISHNELPEVTIVAEENQLTMPQTGIFKLNSQLISRTTALFTEADVLKSFQLIPGVQSGNEGFAAINVRGGSPDQNLILLDGVPTYNLYHLFGFLSTFNPAIVRDATLIKGGIPARYGERLSSVLDIASRDGNTKKSEGSVSISPITGQFSFEAPVVKDKSSILFAARRTWLDGLVNLLSPENPIKYNFNDLNLKYNHNINRNNKLYVGLFTAKDKFFSDMNSGNSAYKFNWGNLSAYLRWNKIYNAKLFGSFTAYHSRFRFVQQTSTENNSIEQNRSVTSSISESSLNTDFDYYPNANHHVRAGLQFSYNVYKPEFVEALGSEVDPALQFAENTAYTANVYIEDDFKIGSHIHVNAGVRESLYMLQGTSYSFFQPRITFSFLLRETSALKISYNRMSQYVHLLTNTAINFPVDLWLPSTKNTKPETADQLTLGFLKKLNTNLSASAEVYYKEMNGLIEYKDGANYIFGSRTNWEEKIFRGNGRSYGLEFFLEKNAGSLAGFLSYTLSRSERNFADINNGRPFPFKYDRRHNLTVYSSYNLSTTKSLSAIFTFANGSWITLPEGIQKGVMPPFYDQTRRYLDGGYEGDFEYQKVITDRNNYQLPAYHRLDINYQTSKMTKRQNKRTWIFSVYNAYNRLNPFFLYEDSGRIKQFTLFPVIPSVGYKLEF